MERMENRVIKIHVLSGHNGAGKSSCFSFLSPLPEYSGPGVFKASKDTIYVRYYGDRTGKQAGDNEDGYLAVYNTITPADRLYTDELLRVDVERAMQGFLPPDPPSRVHVRVVLLFSGFETVLRRMDARRDRAQTDWKIAPSFVESTMGFQIPRAYPFLAINTSNESPAADESRKQEIIRFFTGDDPPPKLMEDRAREARKCIADIKRNTRKLLRN